MSRRVPTRRGADRRVPDGRVIDPTVDQFDEKPDHNLAKGKGFLTKKPSKRAAALIRAARKYI